MKELIRTLIFIVGVVFTKSRKRSKVIYYHDFHDVNSYTDMSTSIELFKKHVAVSKTLGYNIVPKISNGYNELVVMLDDGFKGVWDCKDFFIENEIKPTIFIAKSLVGQDGY